jgi:tetratricopeptide (TPR) repeat protein
MSHELATPVAATSPRRRDRRRVARWGFRSIVAALVGFNVWWFVRDTRPVPELDSVVRLIALRRYDESDRALGEHLRRSPRDGAARMLLAQSLGARGDLLGCAEQLHRVPDWWPRKREALYLEGESFLKVDRARDAEAAWRACVEDDPLHPAPPGPRRAAAEGLIKLYAAQERWEEANEVAWRLFEAAAPADRPGLLILRLRTEVERIAPETRAARLRRYVAADPGDWTSRRGLARAELALGREAEAARQIRACLTARPDDLHAWCDWLEILERRGDVATLADALDRPPDSADDGRAWSFRGRVRQAQGDMTGALEAYRRAASLRPHDDQVLYRLALVERHIGSPERAESLLARSKSLRDARDQLFHALRAYSRAAAAGPPAGPELADETERLATLCEPLGLRPEAQALRSLVSPAF